MRSSVVLPAFLLSCIACSAGGSGVASSSGSSGGTSSFQGTLGGKSFVAQSGLAHTTGGSVDVILSDTSGLCEALKAKRFRGGTTVVQAYNLGGTAPGAFKPQSDHVKYARVKSGCPVGAPIDDNVETSSSASPANTTISISKQTATEVEGEMSVTFKDGSTVSGSFSVPICSESEAEDAICQ
jgi:hypothetical protein